MPSQIGAAGPQTPEQKLRGIRARISRIVGWGRSHQDENAAPSPDPKTRTPGAEAVQAALLTPQPGGGDKPRSRGAWGSEDGQSPRGALSQNGAHVQRELSTARSGSSESKADSDAESPVETIVKAIQVGLDTPISGLSNVEDLLNHYNKSIYSRLSLSGVRVNNKLLLEAFKEFTDGQFTLPETLTLSQLFNSNAGKLGTSFKTALMKDIGLQAVLLAFWQLVEGVETKPPILESLSELRSHQQVTPLKERANPLATVPQSAREDAPINTLTFSQLQQLLTQHSQSALERAKVTEDNERLMRINKQLLTVTEEERQLLFMEKAIARQNKEADRRERATDARTGTSFRASHTRERLANANSRVRESENFDAIAAGEREINFLESAASSMDTATRRELATVKFDLSMNYRRQKARQKMMYASERRAALEQYKSLPEEEQLRLYEEGALGGRTLPIAQCERSAPQFDARAAERLKRFAEIGDSPGEPAQHEVEEARDPAPSPQLPDPAEEEVEDFRLALLHEERTMQRQEELEDDAPDPRAAQVVASGQHFLDSFMSPPRDRSLSAQSDPLRHTGGLPPVQHPAHDARQRVAQQQSQSSSSSVGAGSDGVLEEAEDALG